MRDSAQVVVVGGGVLGSSTAFHLLQEGASDVLLLERDSLAQGTSAAGAGFVGTWAAGSIPVLGDEELEIERYALSFYAELAAGGYDLGYRPNGCLWVAGDEQGWGYLEPVAEHEGVPDRRTLTPEEVEACTGIVRAEEVYGGVIHPSDCQVSAGQASLALAAAFAEGGGQIEHHRPVRRVLVRRGRVEGVDTVHGRVSADVVVLAAGAWTNELLCELGAFAPMVPLVASRIVTEPMGVPLSMPPTYFAGFSSYPAGFLWARGENGRLLWGTRYECPPRNLFVDRPPPERFDQLPLDGLVEVQRLGARLSRLVPLLARYRSFTVAHGAPCYTSDGRALVGEVPGIQGLYVIGGCNETGVTHAPGWGRSLAEQIVHGRSTFTDISVWRLDRFGEEYRTPRDVLDRRRPWRPTPAS